MNAKDKELDRLLNYLQWPEERTDVVEVRRRIHARAAHAVAEARAPLVKVLRAIERKVECPLCGEAIGCGHEPNCQLAAALAKEAPDA